MTQALVLLIIRTAGNPFKSRPSWPLAWSVLGIVFVGMLVPYLPFAELLGFVPLPTMFYLYLVGATSTYLLLVELTKRWLIGSRP